MTRKYRLPAIVTALVGLNRGAPAQQLPTTSVVSADAAVAGAPTGKVSVNAPGKLVGGGACANWRVGSLLTQSAAGPASNVWFGAAKDHLVADPKSLSVLGVALNDPHDDWKVMVRPATSAASRQCCSATLLPIRDSPIPQAGLQ